MEWLIYSLIRDRLPLEVFPGVRLVLWLEVRGAEGALFVAETLKFTCDWFR